MEGEILSAVRGYGMFTGKRKQQTASKCCQFNPTWICSK